MKNTIIFLLLLSSFFSFGQKYSTNSKFLKSENIKIDSIEVQISVYENEIVTESYFEKSKCKLSIVYSKTGKLYNGIRTIENNSKYNYCYRTNTFDFVNGQAINGEENYFLSQNMNGIAGRFEEVKESYNKTLNPEFLKMYVAELYQKTINYR